MAREDSVDAAILDIIDTHPVGDQLSLLELLQGRGFELSQPTLSRHLRKLTVAKQGGRYRQQTAVTATAPAVRVRLSPPNLVVLNTEPGHAQWAGYVLDRAAIGGIAGTVGGDDTVFVAVEDPEQLEGIAAAISGVFGAG